MRALPVAEEASKKEWQQHREMSRKAKLNCCCNRLAKGKKSLLLRRVRGSYISLALIFYVKIRVRSLGCSSFFAKRLARLTCSFVNALTTVRCRFHLFTRVCLRHILYLYHSVFFLHNYSKANKSLVSDKPL